MKKKCLEIQESEKMIFNLKSNSCIEKNICKEKKINLLEKIEKK